MKQIQTRVRFSLGLKAIIIPLMLGASVSLAVAGETLVAVAANFYNPLQEIAKFFQEKTGHKVRIVSGSTGKIYAQIVNGAPFHAFLAADVRRPALLEKEGFAVPKTRFTYALGKISLWSADPKAVTDDGITSLRKMDFNHLAIANPKTAPYGTAAVQTLKKLNLWKTLRPLLVQGESISQTFQFVASGNAELGFVALSQILDPKNGLKGKRWDVPQEFYDALEQDAVLLKKGEGNPAAKGLWAFLKGKEARLIIARYGYGLIQSEMVGE